MPLVCAWLQPRVACSLLQARPAGWGCEHGRPTSEPALPQAHSPLRLRTLDVMRLLSSCGLSGGLPSGAKSCCCCCCCRPWPCWSSGRGRATTADCAMPASLRAVAAACALRCRPCCRGARRVCVATAAAQASCSGRGARKGLRKERRCGGSGGQAQPAAARMVRSTCAGSVEGGAPSQRAKGCSKRTGLGPQQPPGREPAWRPAPIWRIGHGVLQGQPPEPQRGEQQGDGCWHWQGAPWGPSRASQAF